MGRLRYSSLTYIWLVTVLFGCAESITQRQSENADLPSERYKRIAVFTENLDGDEQRNAEDSILSSLRGVGVKASSGANLIALRGVKTENEKQQLFQNQFDAVLYFVVLEKGEAQETVSHDLLYTQLPYNLAASLTAGIVPLSREYIARGDGTVYRPVLMLKAKVELQDTKANRYVWSSETVASGHPERTTLPVLFKQAASQIIARLREDGAI